MSAVRSEEAGWGEVVRLPGADVPPLPVEAPLDPAVVGARLHEEVARRRLVLEDVDPGLGAVVDAVERLAEGGKRLRAGFVLLGAAGASGGEDVPGVLGIATAVELFHLAALVHDDVMDHADERRGVPTVHRVFGSRSADHGTAVGVLAGDLLLTWADDVLARSTEGLPTAPAVRTVWAEMRDQVLAGQYLDLRLQADLGAGTEVDVPDVVRMLQFKSAKYTVEHPLRLGGTLAGAGPDLLDGYAAFGLAVGEAFQLRDDVLDVFGDPRATGKAEAGDLREGKRTLLVALALERGTAAERAVLTRRLGDPALDAAGIAEARDVLVATGARARVEDRITVLVDDARRALAALPLDPRTRAALDDLAEGAAWRSR
ncbi:polyprenyl synthetase family protein [Nocardioides zeae]|uniref:Geranylgeranyl diphosphate synthase type I n=1 Tax=Nocardioides zeae TaxID=1457234 RepID=A0AAJ1X1G8_9ACTN|nr:polyprenyl synthetase family protein [Nocardioides zeae]MDQ1104886.1 geranylgeranyl diphosphate synthase type I [Nocardioides zeae]